MIIEDPREIYISRGLVKVIEGFPDFIPEYNGKIGTIEDLKCDIYLDDDISDNDVIVTDRTTGISYDLRAELIIDFEDFL